MSLALQKNEGKINSLLDHARVLRSLVHIINSIQSGIDYAISKLNGFISNLNQTHWIEMKEFQDI